MAKGINIPIASETKAFKQGIDSGVIAPLEDAQETFDRLGKSGDKAGDTIEKAVDGAERSVKNLGDTGERAGEDLESAMREAQKETKDLDREFKDLGETVRRESRDAGRSLKTNFREGTDGAKEGLKDFKQESASTARESAASFDGSAESIADSFQEVAANAFAGFGPAGAVAGLAAAAGIGVIGAAFDAQGEKAEALAQKTSDMADRIIESGGRVLTAEQERAAVSEAINDPASWQKILDIQKATQVTIGEATRAVALEGAERNGVLSTLKNINDANADLTMSGAISLEQATAENDKARELIGYLGEQNSAGDVAYQKAMAIDGALGNVIAKRSAERDAVQDRNRALQNTPATVNTTLTVDDSALKRALSVKKSIDVVINAVDKFGRSIK